MNGRSVGKALAGTVDLLIVIAWHAEVSSSQ